MATFGLFEIQLNLLQSWNHCKHWTRCKVFLTWATTGQVLAGDGFAGGAQKTRKIYSYAFM